MNFYRQIQILILASMVTVSAVSFAQEGPSKSTGGPSDEEFSADIENIFSSQEQKEVKEETLPTEQEQQKIMDVKQLSDLANLAPFQDVAIIQKRFLPKTGRFELFAAPSIVLNDPFFMVSGANIRLGYYFREMYGFELTAWMMSKSDRQSTKDLARKTVTTTSLISPKNYLGAAFKWAPIYGKFSFFNRTIIPFDHYFNFGLGQTQTSRDENAYTLNLATGQNFAISKAWAFRWDLTWNLYQATTTKVSNGSLVIAKPAGFQ